MNKPIKTGLTIEMPDGEEREGMIEYYFSPGQSGSAWEPPVAHEVDVVSITNEDGTVISEDALTSKEVERIKGSLEEEEIDKAIATWEEPCNQCRGRHSCIDCRA